MKFDIVIIGSGLGGLLCGNILSKEGFKVCLIEKNNKLGGSLQTFGRKARIFNTGLNYTESLDDGQILNQYFRYFGLHGKLKLQRLDTDGFDIISFNNGKYPLASKHDNFREKLLRFFPSEKDGLTRYLNTIRNICKGISLYTLSDKPFNILESSSMSIGAADYIKSEIRDPRLRNVLAGNSLIYAGDEKKTPLLIHSLINNSFIDSSWRIADGSKMMIDILADNITEGGGTIIKNIAARKFIPVNGSISAVELSDGERIEAKYFISNTHPEQVISMLGEMKVPKAFSHRVNTLEDTIGMFTLYLVFKKECFPYLNHNFYHYNQDNVWLAGNYDPSIWPQAYVLMCTASSKSKEYAESASVLTYMKFSELQKWKDTFTGNRGNDYEEFKRRKADLLLKTVEREFPGISGCVEAFYTSTPLTWRDYTGTRGGSAYGLMKDYNKPMESIILPRTKIPNLLLTGQNTNMHGILGVTISAVLTCGELVNLRKLIADIRNA